MWLYFIASFIAERINVVAIFWNERKDDSGKDISGSAKSDGGRESVRNENSLGTFFSIPDYTYNHARGGEKGRTRWCENTFRRGIPGPSFRRFNCFVLAASRARECEMRKWKRGRDGPSRDDINIRDV